MSAPYQDPPEDLDTSWLRPASHEYSWDELEELTSYQLACLSFLRKRKDARARDLWKKRRLQGELLGETEGDEMISLDFDCSQPAKLSCRQLAVVQFHPAAETNQSLILAAEIDFLRRLQEARKGSSAPPARLAITGSSSQTQTPLAIKAAPTSSPSKDVKPEPAEPAVSSLTAKPGSEADLRAAMALSAQPAPSQPAPAPRKAAPAPIAVAPRRSEPDSRPSASSARPSAPPTTSRARTVSAGMREPDLAQRYRSRSPERRPVRHSRSPEDYRPLPRRRSRSPSRHPPLERDRRYSGGYDPRPLPDPRDLAYRDEYGRPDYRDPRYDDPRDFPRLPMPLPLPPPIDYYEARRPEYDPVYDRARTPPYSERGLPPRRQRSPSPRRRSPPRDYDRALTPPRRAFKSADARVRDTPEPTPHRMGEPDYGPPMHSAGSRTARQPEPLPERIERPAEEDRASRRNLSYGKAPPSHLDRPLANGTTSSIDVDAVMAEDLSSIRDAVANRGKTDLPPSAPAAHRSGRPAGSLSDSDLSDVVTLAKFLSPELQGEEIQLASQDRELARKLIDSVSGRYVPAHVYRDLKCMWIGNIAQTVGRAKLLDFVCTKGRPIVLAYRTIMAEMPMPGKVQPDPGTAVALALFADEPTRRQAWPGINARPVPGQTKALIARSLNEINFQPAWSEVLDESKEMLRSKALQAVQQEHKLRANLQQRRLPAPAPVVNGTASSNGIPGAPTGPASSATKPSNHASAPAPATPGSSLMDRMGLSSRASPAPAGPSSQKRPRAEESSTDLLDRLEVPLKDRISLEKRPRTD